MQRLLNTVHMMAKHNIPNAVFEPLIRLQTANGAEMGTQYFSRESFKELLTGLDNEVMEQILQELVEGKHTFCRILRLLNEQESCCAVFVRRQTTQEMYHQI